MDETSPYSTPASTWINIEVFNGGFNAIGPHGIPIPLQNVTYWDIS